MSLLSFSAGGVSKVHVHTHTIISLIQLLRMLVTTGDNLILFMRIACTLSKRKQKLCLSVSLILKSCIFTNATLEMIQVIKKIFTITYTTYTIATKRILFSQIVLLIKLLCLGQHLSLLNTKMRLTQHLNPASTYLKAL